MFYLPQNVFQKPDISIFKMLWFRKVRGIPTYLPELLTLLKYIKEKFYPMFRTNSLTSKDQ